MPAFTGVCQAEFEKLGVGGFIPEDEYPGAGSSDIGNVSYVCPTVYLEIALQSENDVVVHDQSAMETVTGRMGSDGDRDTCLFLRWGQNRCGPCHCSGHQKAACGDSRCSTVSGEKGELKHSN